MVISRPDFCQNIIFRCWKRPILLYGKMPNSIIRCIRPAEFCVTYTCVVAYDPLSYPPLSWEWSGVCQLKANSSTLKLTTLNFLKMISYHNTWLPFQLPHQPLVPLWTETVHDQLLCMSSDCQWAHLKISSCHEPELYYSAKSACPVGGNWNFLWFSNSCLLFLN